MKSNPRCGRKKTKRIGKTNVLSTVFVTSLLVVGCAFLILSSDSSEATVVGSGTYGEKITWSLNDQGTLIISGQGEMPQEGDNYDNAPWLEYSDQIRSLVVEAGVETISAHVFYGCMNLHTATLPSTIRDIGWAFSTCGLTEITIPGSVDTIGYGAFEDCKYLRTVVIEEGVTTIDQNAFYNCVSLRTLSLPDSLEVITHDAFWGCISLSTLTLPSNLMEIGEHAFYDCMSLVEVINHSSLELTLGSTSYGGVAEHAKFLPSQSILRTDERGFEYYESEGRYYLHSYLGEGGVVVLPDDLEGSDYYIGDYGLYYLGKTCKIVISDGVLGIGEKAFDGSRMYIRSVTLGKNVSSIETSDGDYFMYGVYEIINNSDHELDNVYNYGDRYVRNGSSVVDVDLNGYVYSHIDDTYYVLGYVGEGSVLQLPEDICGSTYVVHKDAFTELQNNCPQSMTHIDRIVVSDGVDSITSQSITGLLSIKNIEVAVNSTRYSVVDGVLFTKDMSKLVMYPCGSERDTYDIPASVTTITEYAFYGVQILKTIRMTDNVTEIGPYAFAAYNLESVRLSNSITSIPDSAFLQSSIATIEIPNSVTYIGDFAFGFCSNLDNVVLPAGLTHIGSRCFDSCTSLSSIVVPEGVTVLGVWAFYGCTALESITVPYSIDTAYFAYQLPSITYMKLGFSPDLGGSDIFDGITFYDTDGTTVLEVTPAALAGYIYTGTAEKMVRQPTSKVFFRIDGEVVYSVIYEDVNDDVVGPTSLIHERYNYEWPSFELTGSDVIVDANITPKSFTVTLDTGDGTMKSGQYQIEYTYGTSLSLPTADALDPYVHEGYDVTFLGWYISTDYNYSVIGEIAAGTFGDLTVVALWQEDYADYKVYYKVDGVVEITETHGYTSRFYVQGIFYKQGHTVTEWASTDVDVVDGMCEMPAHDVVFTATSSPNMYGYYVNYNDELYRMLLDDYFSEALYGSQVTPEVPEIEGYYSPEAQTITITDGTNAVIYVYTPKLYDVIYLVDGVEVYRDHCYCGNEVIVRNVYEKVGHTVSQWESNGRVFSNTEGFIMGAANVTMAATSSPNQYAYRVEYRIDSLNMMDYYVGQALYGSQVTPEVRTFTGYTSPSPQTITISDNESLNLVVYYYAVKQFDAIYLVDGAEVYRDTYDYEEIFHVRDPYLKAGHTVTRWVPSGTVQTSGDSIIMGAADITFTATSTPNSYGYRVHCTDMSGHPLLSSDFISTAAYGSQVTPTPQEITGYSLPSPQTITISDDESKNVIVYTYTIRQFNVIYLVDGINVATEAHDYGSQVEVRAVHQKVGHTVTPWSTQDVVLSNGTFVIGAADITFTATSTPNSYRYTVNYVNGNNQAIADPYVSQAPYGSNVTAEFIPVAGYNPPAQSAVITISDDESLNVTTYCYTPKDITIIFDTNGGSEIAPKVQKFGTYLSKPANPTKAGFIFDGWDQPVPSTVPAEDTTFHAVWIDESMIDQLLKQGDPNDRVWSNDVGMYVSQHIVDPQVMKAVSLDINYLIIHQILPESDIGDVNIKSVDMDLTYMAGMLRTSADYSQKQIVAAYLNGNIELEFVMEGNYVFGQSTLYNFSNVTDDFKSLDAKKGDRIVLSIQIDSLMVNENDDRFCKSVYDADDLYYRVHQGGNQTYEGVISATILKTSGSEQTTLDLGCEFDVTRPFVKDWVNVLSDRKVSAMYTRTEDYSGSVGITLNTANSSVTCAYSEVSKNESWFGTSTTSGTVNLSNVPSVFKFCTYADVLSMSKVLAKLNDIESESSSSVTKEETGFGLTVKAEDEVVSKEVLDILVEQAKADTTSTLTVSYGDMKVQLDNTALKNLNTMDCSVSLKKLDAAQFNVEEGAVVMEISLGGNHTNFNGGKLTITVPYTGSAKNPTAYYVVDGELIEPVTCRVNGDGTVSFEVMHLSTFAIAEAPDTSDEKSFPIVPVVIGAVVALILVVGTVVLLKKRS